MLIHFNLNNREIWFGYDEKDKRIYLQIDHRDLGKQKSEPFFDTYGPHYANWTISQSISKCLEYGIKIPQDFAIQAERDALQANWETVQKVVWEHLHEKEILKSDQKEQFFTRICKENKNDVAELFIGLFRAGELDNKLGKDKAIFEKNILSDAQLNLISEKAHSTSYHTKEIKTDHEIEKEIEHDL